MSKNERPITLDYETAGKAVTFNPGVGGAMDLRVLLAPLDPQPPATTPPDVVRIEHPSPHGDVGTILWVREHTTREGGAIRYGLDTFFSGGAEWKSPSAMPRKLARLFLRVTATRLAYEPIPRSGSPRSWWFWETHVEVLRDRKAKLCPPGPEAVWRASFWHALDAADGVSSARAEEVAKATLAPLFEAGDWAALREHVLTFAATWFRSTYVGLMVTRAVMGLVRAHRQRIPDAWQVLVEKERVEKRAVRENA